MFNRCWYGHEWGGGGDVTRVIASICYLECVEIIVKPLDLLLGRALVKSLMGASIVAPEM